MPGAWRPRDQILHTPACVTAGGQYSHPAPGHIVGARYLKQATPIHLMIPVALIEDHRLVREGITALLNGTGECRVVAAMDDVDVAALQAADPQIVLIDVGVSHGSCLQMVRTLTRDIPTARVIMMDLLPVSEEVTDFVNAGVVGFIMKDATLENLVDTIRAVACGEHILPQELTSTLFAQIAEDAVANGAPQARESVRMTPREREVIELISEGLSNKRIASRLGIAPQTVKSHVRNIMEKLALHTRLQIAAYNRPVGRP